MLEGIEILNKVEIMESPMWISVVGLVFCVLFFISFMAAIMDAFKDFSDGHLWIFALGIVISYITIIIMSNVNKQLKTEPTGQYEYQVTIDDSVSINELLEKYEIVEVNGKIYIIREKE